MPFCPEPPRLDKKSKPKTPETQPAENGEPPDKKPPVITTVGELPWNYDPEQSPDDWVKTVLRQCHVTGLDSEQPLRTYGNNRHRLDYDALFERARLAAEYYRERAVDIAHKRQSLRDLREATPVVLKDPSGAKEMTLWSLVQLIMLGGATVVSVLAGLGYSYNLAQQVGIAEQPADAAMLAVCLLGVAGFLHVVYQQLPTPTFRQGFLILQSVIGTVSAVLFWLLLADGAAGAVEAQGFYAATELVEPDTPPVLSGIAFCVLEACATSVFLHFVLRFLDGLNPKTIRNPDLMLIEQQLDAITEAEDTIAANLAQAEAISNSREAHREACVELLVATWRSKREAHAYKLNELV